MLAEPPGFSSNVSLFYLPGVAEPQRYVKLHPVPFAEYIPSRAFFRIFTPMVDLAGNFVAGHEVGVFQVPAAGGDYVALPTICFEVAYDELMRDSVEAAGDDASLLVVQTNNATFGYTAESEQQFAISPDPGHRARPVGRARLDGRGLRVRRPRRHGHREDRRCSPPTSGWPSPVVRTERTPADRLGAVPEWVAAAALLAAPRREHPGRPER